MQNDSIDSLRLDLNKGKVRGCFYVRQGDTKTRTIHITIANNGSVVPLDNCILAELLMKKPDGAENDQAMTVFGNELQYHFRTQDVNVVGETLCQVMLTFDDGSVVTSPNFSVFVFQKEVNQEYEQSMNEYTAITQQLVEVNNLAKQTSKDKSRVEGLTANTQTLMEITMSLRDEAIGARNEAEDFATQCDDAKDFCGASVNVAEGYRDEVEAKATEILSYEYKARECAALADKSAVDALRSEEAAKASEQSALDSKQSASNSEEAAGTFAKASQSYAMGGTDYRVDDDTENAKHYYEEVKRIAGGITGGLTPMGTISFDELSTVTLLSGYLYNISNDFESDERFKDGGGKQYPAGTDVYVTSDLMIDCLSGSSVVGVKGCAESNYRKGYVTILPEDIGLGNVDNTSDMNKPISQAQQIAFDDVNNLISGLQKIVDDLSGDVGDLDTRLAAVEESITTIGGALNTLSTDITNITKTLAAVTSKLSFMGYPYNPS